MITADAFQVQDHATGHFLHHTIVEVPAGLTNPCRWGFLLDPDQRRATVWIEDHVDRFIGDTPRYAPEFDGRLLKKVHAPACGCCGKIERGCVDAAWQITLHSFRLGRLDNESYWRCEKHVGRNPCCIEGCGKTFAHKPGEDYGWTIMCGRHWRQAPKWMRDAVARVKRLAKRRGWSEALCNRHHRLWERCHRAIREGLANPPAEIVSGPSSGPPPAALIGELERLGL